MSMYRRFASALALLAPLAFAAPAPAQDWPTKPVTLVVPFSTGVSSDVLGRSMAEFIGAKIGQPVIVENKGGAAGNIGAAAVARAQPDGYTLLLATTGQAATNKLMYANMAYDPDKDLTPIVLLGKLPVVIVARKGGKFADMAALLAAARAGEETINVGYPGNGTLGHITGLLFARSVGGQFNDIQYQGSGKIIGDLMGGHIDAAMDSAGGYMGAFKDGGLVPLAIASARRSPLLPETPTVSEAGLPGFEASVWYALFAPAGAPAPILEKVNAAANAYLASEPGKALFARLGLDPAGGTPADLKAFVAAEQAKWGPVIRDAKIRF